MSDDSTPPKDTIPYTALWNRLGPEGKIHVKEMQARIRPRIAFMQTLRESLGFTEVEFIEWMLKDEFEGLPADVPRRPLSLTKILEKVQDEGGSISITITLNGKTTDILFP